MWWIKALQSLLQALQAGHELARPAAWKNVQLVASLLTAILGVLWALGFRLQLMPDDIFAIAGAIVAAINAYLVVATSKKVGISGGSTVKDSSEELVEPDYPVVSPSGVCVPTPTDTKTQSAEERSNSDRFSGWGDR